MWNFEIKHVSRKKNIVANALLRYLKPKGWKAPKELEDDVKEFIKNLIANIKTRTLRTSRRVLQDKYSKELEEYAIFLTTARALRILHSKLLV
jgi:hypothetical protein